MNDSTDNNYWYALRVTYSRELALKNFLDREGIENFIPMRYEYIVKDERRVRKLVPAVHNLVFVCSSRARIDAIKESVGLSSPIRYIMDRETRQPIIVPDIQMRSFMAVAGNCDQQLVYLEPSTVSFRKGERVRVTGGIFEGVDPCEERPPCSGFHSWCNGSSHHLYPPFAHRTYIVVYTPCFPS